MELYNMLIQNACNFLKTQKQSKTPEDQRIDIFEISEVLGICLCKAKEDIIIDMISLMELVER